MRIREHFLGVDYKGFKFTHYDEAETVFGDDGELKLNIPKEKSKIFVRATNGDFTIEMSGKRFADAIKDIKEKIDKLGY